MVDINAIKERKKLRLDILTQLYNLYFHSPTQNQSLHGKTKEIIGDRNGEKHLAFHYLLTSGYIHMDSTGDHSAVMVTAKGIDYVETVYERI